MNSLLSAAAHQAQNTAGTDVHVCVLPGMTATVMAFDVEICSNTSNTYNVPKERGWMISRDNMLSFQKDVVNRTPALFNVNVLSHSTA